MKPALPFELRLTRLNAERRRWKLYQNGQLASSGQMSASEPCPAIRHAIRTLLAEARADRLIARASP